MLGWTRKTTPSSLISETAVVKGSVKSDDEVYVDGVFEGDISARVIVVGINGRIKSSAVRAEKIAVYGTVDGNISAASVWLGATARINGNIVHRDISIENGAFVNGDLKQRRD
ncbi:MAG: polymer-forming cytoskeletal protein [Rickettsiales bacterium]|jgi:cytoskeletal protein CcmA (bactofilin family)|nr:polymer-forming cytoskeletal protein [Rickettsiales bacterium]